LRGLQSAFTADRDKALELRADGLWSGRDSVNLALPELSKRSLIGSTLFLSLPSYFS
jgi:hypothetical protein